MRSLGLLLKVSVFLMLQGAVAAYAMKLPRNPAGLEEAGSKISSKKEKVIPKTPLQIDVVGTLETIERSAQFFFISRLSDKDLGNLRLTSQAFKKFIDLFFFGPVYDLKSDVQAFSSEVSPGTISSNIFTLLSQAEKQIIIASDKCTNSEFLDDLLSLKQQKALDIKIVTGVDSATEKLFKNPKYKDFTYDSIASNAGQSGGRMHNKFIVVDKTMVLTGSPNMTYAAYNYNVESFVAIHHGFVARLYLRYYDYIISGKNKYDKAQKEYQRVKKMLDVFNNARDNPIQVALAPIWNIKTFVTKEITGKKLININMFLVSRGKPADSDIVNALLEASQTGTKIHIKVDKEQYETQHFMQIALQPLQVLGQEIYTVSKKQERIKTKTKEITTTPLFHDKLLLLEGEGEIKKICIGSAGFSKNVQDNLNLENMVLLHADPKAYATLMLHFEAINNTRNELMVTKL